VPGFNDAHLRLLDGGLALGGVDLDSLTTLAAVEREIATWAALHPDAPWVVGRGWHRDMFSGARPTRQLLDRIVADRPAYLASADGQAGWANTAALRAAGITKQTADPPNGTIVRERSGEPSGALLQTAADIVARRVARPSRDAQLAAIRSAIREAHRLGITSVQNAGGGPDSLELYGFLRQAGELDLRVYDALPIDGPLDAEALDRLDAVAEAYPDDPILKAGAVELVLDGSVESGAAALLEPATGAVASRAVTRFDQAALNLLVASLDRRGWQILIDATGDAAVRMAVDAFAHAAAVNEAPARGRRHRIARIEAIDEADVPRIGALGLTASMLAPRLLAAQRPSSWAERLGPTRAAHAWPFRQLLRDGGRIVLGSGWPAGPLDPRIGLLAAVNRPGAEDRLPLTDAVDADTRHAAWASFDDHRKGVIAPEMLADLVILSKDIFTLPPEALTEAEVEMTIFGGRIVYDRSSLMTSERSVNKMDRQVTK
jgi:predicted amidohydrolase YtcJ